jgi:peptidoglycan hydrolase CwlO-like protein
VLTSALVFTGPAVEGTTFSGYINSGLEKVYAKTQKQKDAEKKKSQAEQDLKDKKNEINGLKDQQQTTADDIKNKSAKLDEILAAQKKLQTDITSKQAEIEQNQKDLAAAQEKQQEQYDAMKKRIQFMYENSAEDNIWTAIIESNGITDMLNRIEYVSDVYDSDRALMDSYQAAVEQVKEIGTKLVVCFICINGELSWKFTFPFVPIVVCYWSGLLWRRCRRHIVIGQKRCS